MPRLKIEISNDSLKKLSRLASIGAMSVDDVIETMVQSTNLPCLALVEPIPKESSK
jgi:hypothetical protein